MMFRGLSKLMFWVLLPLMLTEERASTGTMPTDRGYTGQLEADEVGLYYYNARWYDQELARFVTPDSIVPDPYNLLDWDRYVYARSNPILYNDPSGHIVKLPCIPGISCEGDLMWSYPNNEFEAIYEIGSDLLCTLDITLNQVISNGPLEALPVLFADVVVTGAIVSSTQQSVLRQNQIIGQTAEGQANITKNTAHIESLTGTANYRIPDQLIREQNLLSEVKNVRYQSFTAQIEDFLLYSQQEGLRFELIVRENTTISQPLQKLVDKGTISLIRGLSMIK